MSSGMQIRMPSQKEFNILLQCIRLDDKADAAGKAEEIIRSGDVDCGCLYDRARAHNIRPQLAQLMNRITPAVVPEEFRERINDYYRQNLSLQLRNVSEFFRVKEILDNEGIAAVPFKGFSQAKIFYESLADREGTDVDLFIDFKDFDRVLELMTINGYKPEASSSPAFIRKIKKESAEYNFERYEGNEMVFHAEFHWKLGSSAHGMNISLADLEEQVARGSLLDKDMELFSPSAALLLAVMHHGGKDPFIWLKHVSDIGRIMMKDEVVDWDWVVRMARRYDMERLLYMALRVASVMTGVPVSEKLKAVVETPAVIKLADGRMRMMQVDPQQWNDNRYKFRNLLFHMRSRTGMKVRTAMLWQSCRSSVVAALAPKKLLRVYLRKRYRIDRQT
jgi:hypothetical protein